MAKKHRKKKNAWVPVVKTVTVLLTLALICLVALRAMEQYVIFLDGQPVLLTEDTVDLRENRITVEQYRELSEKMEGKRILWSIPIGSGYYESNAGSIILEELSEGDIPNFAYFENLMTVDARNCDDHGALAALETALPETEVNWVVHLGGSTWSREEKVIDLVDRQVSFELLMDTLAYFGTGTRVELGNTELTQEEKQTLRETFPELVFEWKVELFGKTYSSVETKLSFAGEDVEPDALIAGADRFAAVEEVDLTGCGFSVAELLAVQEAFPGAFIRSEITLYGNTFTTGAEEIDLSENEMEDTAAVEEILPLMPNLKKVDMCGCGISNEEMDALNKRHPEVKFVWTVKIGKATVRTDITGFIGAKYGYIPNANIRNPYEDKYRRLFDEDCVNFKYCTDIIVMDLGHMGVSDYSFLEYMPNLKYLILADTQGTDFSVLAKLENLIYLELFMTEFKQTELLLNLTKLENLNLGFLHLENPDVLKEMTWLEMLWIPGTHLSNEKYQEIVDALPNTVVNTKDVDSTSSGWRQSQNYYDMRDILDIYYLK